MDFWREEVFVDVADGRNPRQEQRFTTTPLEKDALEFTNGTPRRQENRPARQLQRGRPCLSSCGKSRQHGIGQHVEKGLAGGNGEHPW